MVAWGWTVAAFGTGLSVGAIIAFCLAGWRGFDRAEQLWSLLDAIDSLDEIASRKSCGHKSVSDARFREAALDIARKRHEILVSDGQLLYIPGFEPALTQKPQVPAHSIVDLSKQWPRGENNPEDGDHW